MSRIDTLSQAVVVALGLLALYFVKITLSKRHNAQRPPGPAGLSLVGNIYDLPTEDIPEYQHWLKHKDVYGPLSSITVLGQTIVVIHDKAVALELMEKRASIHSGRPHMKFAMDMCGWGDILASLPYGDTHRLYRKYTYQQIGSKAAISNYHALQEAAVGHFLWQMSRDKGENLVRHLQAEAAEIILEIVYGYAIDTRKRDLLVERVDDAMEHFSAATVPGKWIVDVMPFLSYLPEWFPGTGFKHTARHWKQTLMSVVEEPYRFVESQMASERNRPSFVSRSIEQARSDGQEVLGSEEEHAIKWAAASMYTGGADTSVTTMETFFLAMSMFPEVQRNAQEEIDRVVGTARLPTFADRENLPYINAVVEEAQRWHPIAPMGLPHATDQEDFINGYRIPKDALLLPAIWWFTRDPEVYHDAETFKPERFLEPYNEPPATSVTFGFGRRVCPGKALADSSLYLMFAQSLAVFDIGKAVDGQGREIEPGHSFGSGIIAKPASFGVRVVPRSHAHAELIAGVMEKQPWRESNADCLRSMAR